MSTEMIHCGVDDTDHLAFFCDGCRSMLNVERVETRRVQVAPGKTDSCTWVYLVCPKHGKMGWRKFYWKADHEVENHYHYRTDADAADTELCQKPA